MHLERTESSSGKARRTVRFYTAVGNRKRHELIIMRRAKRAAGAIFSWFFKGKKAYDSYRIAYEGKVPRITLSVCSYVCLYQVLRPRLSTAPSVHCTKASADGSCARTNDRQLFSCWFCCKSLRVRRDRRDSVWFHRHQLLGVRHFVISQASLGYVIYEYSMVFAAACCCTSIPISGG